MSRKPAIIGVLVCLCAAAADIAIFSGLPPQLDSKERKQWKERAIAEITKQTSDTGSVLQQVGTIKAKRSSESEWHWWISEDLIVMTNGEWMAYRNICIKEEGRIPDLFIGRGSDDTWYYSTYHFCIGMIILKDMVGQPESLTKFRADCFLQEFDGHSNECLKKTWPLKH